MRIRLLVCALTAPFVVAAACDGSGGGSTSIDSLGPTLAKSTCARMFRCCDATEIMMAFDGLTIGGQPITTEDQCVQAYTGLVTQLAVPGYKMSIAAGRVSYDGQAASSCFEMLDGLACTDGSDLETVCEAYLVPLVSDGGACSQSYECTSNYCDMSGGGGDGVCKAKPTAGMPCSGGDCAAGNYCDFGAASPVCVATLANGMACDGNDMCTSTHCTGDFSTPGTCEVDMTCNGI